MILWQLIWYQGNFSVTIRQGESAVWRHGTKGWFTSKRGTMWYFITLLKLFISGISHWIFLQILVDGGLLNPRKVDLQKRRLTVSKYLLTNFFLRRNAGELKERADVTLAHRSTLSPLVCSGSLFQDDLRLSWVLCRWVCHVRRQLGATEAGWKWERSCPFLLVRV